MAQDTGDVRYRDSYSNTSATKLPPITHVMSVCALSGVRRQHESLSLLPSLLLPLTAVLLLLLLLLLLLSLSVAVVIQPKRPDGEDIPVSDVHQATPQTTNQQRCVSVAVADPLSHVCRTIHSQCARKDQTDGDVSRSGIELNSKQAERVVSGGPGGQQSLQIPSS